VATYAALLRGINLGARNRVAMADLRALVEELGGRDVATYVQSGNVVFRHTGAAARLERDLAQSIQRALGLEIAVLVRSSRRLTAIVDGNPFLAAGADPAHLHLTLLGSSPDRAGVRRAIAASGAPEELAVKGKEIYLHLPAGYGRSKLSNAFFERHLGVRATTRNWRTVSAIAELAAGT
jgi:uncharacterized protein (DUF1697 family)